MLRSLRWFATGLVPVVLFSGVACRPAESTSPSTRPSVPEPPIVPGEDSVPTPPEVSLKWLRIHKPHLALPDTPDNLEAYFPQFMTTLSDPTSDPTHVHLTLGLVRIAQQAPDRRQFAPLAVRWLTTSRDDDVRRAALRCLQEIGTEREAAVIVPLLADGELTVHHLAAETLAKIGGKRELEAMDTWLKSGAGRHRDGQSLQHVKGCRDSLESRLKATPKNL